MTVNAKHGCRMFLVFPEMVLDITLNQTVLSLMRSKSKRKYTLNTMLDCLIACCIIAERKIVKVKIIFISTTLLLPFKYAFKHLSMVRNF